MGISDDTYAKIRADADEALGQFRTGTGVDIPIAGHLVTARSASR